MRIAEVASCCVALTAHQQLHCNYLQLLHLRSPLGVAHLLLETGLLLKSTCKVQLQHSRRRSARRRVEFGSKKSIGAHRNISGQPRHHQRSQMQPSSASSTSSMRLQLLPWCHHQRFDQPIAATQVCVSSLRRIRCGIPHLQLSTTSCLIGQRQSAPPSAGKFRASRASICTGSLHSQQQLVSLMLSHLSGVSKLPD